MKKYFIALLICSLSLANVGWAGTLEGILQRKTLRVGMEPGYMPFGLIDQYGRIVGFDVDMANHMAEQMGVALQIVRTSWDNIINDLRADKFDIIMSGMTLTQARNLRVNFAKPYIVIGQTVLIRKELAEQVSAHTDLNEDNYHLGAKKLTSGEMAVKEHLPKARYSGFGTAQEAVAALIEGRIDAFVYDAPFNAIANIRHGDALVFLDQPFTFEPLAWAVRRGDPDFLNWLDNFVVQVNNDGTYDRLYRKWFRDDRWLKHISP
jgi:polar amino acid transport system substrate-binding protein